MLNNLIRAFVVIGIASAIASCSTTVETQTPPTQSTTTTTTTHGYFR